MEHRPFPVIQISLEIDMEAPIGMMHKAVYGCLAARVFLHNPFYHG